MRFTMFLPALAFIGLAAATPAISTRELVADAALNSLISDSLTGAFPGVVATTASGPRVSCRVSQDCPRCKKCTYCDDWTPGCCKRISPVCGSDEAAAAVAADSSAKPLCTFCSSKACFQVECQADQAPGDVVDAGHDHMRRPFWFPLWATAETLYDFDLLLDDKVEDAGDCDYKGVACNDVVCGIKKC